MCKTLDQVRQVNQRIEPEGRRVRNVVFMGMGEPLLNTERNEAVDQLLIQPALTYLVRILR